MENPLPVVTIDMSELERLTRNLIDYEKVFGRLTMPEVLEKKGNDARINLWRLFWEDRYGTKKAKNSPAWIDLRKRTRAGIGTNVRVGELDARWGAPPELDKRGRKLSGWQKLVWQEITRRRSGAGLLGVSFLSKRFRLTQSRGKFLVDNVSKSLGKLVEIQKGNNYFQITGFTPGLATIEAKNQILNKTVKYLNDDIEVYLTRKMNEALKLSFT